MEWWYLILLPPLIFFVLIMGPLFLGRLFLPRLTIRLFRRFGGYLARLLDLISQDLDLRLMVRAGNRYFRHQFAATPFNRRLFFLPFCLRPPQCPAEMDPAQGVLCQGGCPGCEVGKIRDEALALGYAQVYLVPSSRIMRGKGLMPSHRFIGEKLKKYAPTAALGVTCGWNLRHRLMANHSVGSKGYPAGDNGPKSVLQGVLLKDMNCRNASVDWDQVRCLLALSVAEPKRAAASKTLSKSLV